MKITLIEDIKRKEFSITQLNLNVDRLTAQLKDRDAEIVRINGELQISRESFGNTDKYLKDVIK